jgi:hypothetical protein
MNLLPPVLFLLALLAFSVACLCAPRRIHAIAKRLAKYAKPKFVRDFVESDHYLWNLRLIGAIGVVFVLPILFLLLFGK